MQNYQRRFIEFMVDTRALTFGDYTLKSGRKSPFFINTGNFYDGYTSMTLANCYAQAINQHFPLFDVIFGPAYKGIPLAISVAMSYYELYRRNVRWCSNRKEEKDHGDGGKMLGYQPQNGDRVLIIDDVMTSGSSIRESVSLLKGQAEVEIAGVIVAMDRHERGAKTELPALMEIGKELGVEARAIASMPEASQYLFSVDMLDEEQLIRINHYYELYGPSI